jgi:gamma-glutamylcyclotransferase (GGCT)/AIG2-like uncharacterized protein YtfP
MTPLYYFAYGSNMDPKQMARRCPDAVPVGVATLQGYDIVINSRGTATIVPVGDEPAVVEGVLWEVTDNCLRCLDRYEGVPKNIYVRHTVQVAVTTGLVEATTYVATTSERGEPRDGYLEKILAGAAYFGLPPDYIRKLEHLSVAKLKRELSELTACIEGGNIARAPLWGGAGVVIVQDAPAPRRGGFYSEPTYVSTRWPGELSWLFHEVVRLLSPRPFYNSVTKFAIFGRLAEAAQRSEPLAAGPADLLRAVLAELYAMVHEVSRPVALNP